MHKDIVERLHYAGDEAPDNLISLIWEAADEIDRLRAALREIKWRSADRDNMEFSATITYSQMDKIRAALGEKA